MALEGTVTYQALPRSSPPPKTTIQVRVPTPRASPSPPAQLTPRPNLALESADWAALEILPTLHPTPNFIQLVDISGLMMRERMRKILKARRPINMAGRTRRIVLTRMLRRIMVWKTKKQMAEDNNAGGGFSPEF
ncbi:hypothetical protein BDR22DRAFT_889245 [Usnea florida]